jgi:hypothetical protein
MSAIILLTEFLFIPSHINPTPKIEVWADEVAKPLGAKQALVGKFRNIL